MVASLPEEQTSFVGRRADLARLDQALTEHRLVTLTGVGGVGKSRLALRSARRVSTATASGRGTAADVWWVELSPLMGDRLLVSRIAGAVGLADHTLRMPVEALCAWLADREGLLVLDSCEHVVSSCREVVTEVLAAAPGVRVLATSRRRLGVRGERVLAVAPLRLAAADADSGDAAGDSDALDLFTARAVESAPGAYAAAVDWTAAAARICARLDGVPLALELAAAQLRRHSVEEVAEQLRYRRASLRSASGASVVPARHRALRTTIGWSHELSTPLARLLWARMSVLRGACDTATVQKVCAGGPLTEDGVGAALVELAEQSVITWRSGHWTMLDTVREYGREWLRKLGEERYAVDRHAAYFLALARGADAAWLSREQPAWYGRVSLAHADLCAALDHLLVNAPERALELAGCVGFYWSCCGHLHEARDYLERGLLEHADAGPVRTKALWALGVVLLLQGEQEAAAQVARECEQASAHDVVPEGRLAAAYLAGLTYLMSGRPLVALHKAERAIARTPAGVVARSPSGMRCHLVRVFALTALGALGDAEELAVEMRGVCEEMGESWTRSYLDYQLALIALSQDRALDAARHARAMLAGKRRLGDRFGIALGLDLLAAACAAQGQSERAAFMFGAGHAFWRTVGHPQRGTPELAPVREQAERTARAALGAESYALARQRGAQDIESSLEAALREG
ncbi:ATP-binding protein [Streptomyces silaceus]|uniref:ATP-binding protein n=1 Tax=Streptomyces silaceus TaxID=545123 RepID=UPI0006EB7A33|nr:NB-ARC domain-containing protein [Streptomyces silaceus]